MSKVRGQRIGTRIAARFFAVLSAIALVFLTVSPNASHVPKIVDTLQDHAQMIAEHGHSHGLEEDLIWAMHGHDHDAADHDHSQAVLTQARSDAVPVEVSAAWDRRAQAYWSAPLSLLERPPRV